MKSSNKILMLYTGGTIGMKADEKTGTLAPFDFDFLLEQIPELKLIDCTIDTDSLDAPIDSSNIKPEHWTKLARRIEQDYHNYHGFVILHGSDTMAYTASALSFMLQNLSKPVILTGAQLPIGIPRSDARENLITTIEIATAKRSDQLAMVPEVCVYFEYNLYRGNRTHKTSTEDFEAFYSFNYPLLAQAGVNIKFNEAAILTPPGEPFRCSPELCTDVAVLTMFPGIQPHFVQSVLNNPEMKGLLLRTFGSGNAPTDKWLIDAVTGCMDRNVKVVNVSQCDGGAVNLGKYEASKALADAGIISSYDMTFEAALVKMMYLLEREADYKNFKLLFETPLRGELTRK